MPPPIQGQTKPAGPAALGRDRGHRERGPQFPPLVRLGSSTGHSAKEAPRPWTAGGEGGSLWPVVEDFLTFKASRTTMICHEQCPWADSNSGVPNYPWESPPGRQGHVLFLPQCPLSPLSTSRGQRQWEQVALPWTERKHRSLGYQGDKVQQAPWSGPRPGCSGEGRA